MIFSALSIFPLYSQVRINQDLYENDHFHINLAKQYNPPYGAKIIFLAVYSLQSHSRSRSGIPVYSISDLTVHGS